MVKIIKKGGISIMKQQKGEVIELFPKSAAQVVAEHRAKRKAETERFNAEIEALKRKIGVFKKDDGNG
jgi:predicted nuclease with RNAse H fold